MITPVETLVEMKIKIDYYYNQIFLTLSSTDSGTNNFLFPELPKSMYVRLRKKRKLTGNKLFIPGGSEFANWRSFGANMPILGRNDAFRGT